MPIHFVDRRAYVGQVAASLDSVIALAQGTHVRPPGRTGFIGSQVAGITSSILGGVTSNANRTGIIAASLEAITGLIIGHRSWQLTSHVAAKMAPAIIHPRPDDEMSADELAARCPSGVQWEIPVVILGGSYPFHCDLIVAPSGASIVPDWTADQYTAGRIRWPNPTVGNHTFTVVVTDQDGTIRVRTWTLEVIDRENPQYFCFLDAVNGNDANSGAYSSPRRTTSGMYGPNKSSTFSQGKQTYYRAGAYQTTDMPLDGVKVGFTNGKSKIHVGFPGEIATIAGGDAAYWDVESTAPPGWAFCNLRWLVPSVPEASATLRRKQCVRFSNVATRTLIFNNFVDGQGNTLSVGGSNSSAFMFASTGAPNEFMSVVGNTLHNCDNMDLVLYYNCFRTVAEHNYVTGSYGGTHNPSWGLFLKGASCSEVSFRANTMIGANKIRPLVHFSEFSGPPFHRSNIEVCFNNAVALQDAGRASGFVAMGQGSSSQANGYGPYWQYRNNARIAYMAPQALQDGPFQIERDCIQHNGVYLDGIILNDCPGVALITVPATAPNQFAKVDLATATSGMFDSTTNLLIGAARTAYFRTHGCELG